MIYMNKNIAFVVTSMSSGGGERNVSKIANHLVTKEYNVFIILLFSNVVFYDLDPRIKIIDLSRNFKHKQYHICYYANSIRKLVKKHSISKVIGVGQKYGLISALGILFNRKCKVIVRGTNTYKLSSFMKMGYFFLKGKIQTIVCQTKAQYETYPSFLRKKTLIIPNPFSRDTQKCHNGFSSKIIISVARLEVLQKRQEMMLQIFSKFYETHKDFKLIFIGKDPSTNKENTKNLTLLAQRLNIYDSIKFIGEVKDVSKYYHGSFAMLVCSVREGMPNSMIEAMICGVPVISTDWNGVDEIIEDGVNGLIFNDQDIDAAVKYLNELCDSKTKYESISIAARNIQKQYDETVVFDKWLSLL